MTRTDRLWRVGERGSPAEAVFSSFHDVLTALRDTARRDPLTIVAPASQLTFDALERLAVAVPGLAVSVVPADDADRLTDSPPERSGEGAWLVYDALRRESCASQGEDAHLADLLTQQWDLVGLIGHGDGSHLNLGTAVLCGLCGPRESTSSGVATHGCHWDPAGCKKQVSMPVVHQAGRLRTHTLTLFSCTSLSLAQQVYPSNVSLALAAYRAGVPAVIGATRQVQFTARFVAETLELMGQLPTLGAVVAALNAQRRVTEDGALALLGWADTAPPAAAARAAHAAVTARWPASPRRLAPSLTYLTVPRSAVKAVPDLDAQLSTLTAIASRLTALDHVLRGLTWLARPTADDPVQAHLARVEAARVRGLEAVRRERFELLRGQSDLARPTQRRTQALRVVEEAMLGLLRTRVLDESHSGGGVGDIVAPALALFLDREAPIPTGEHCAHCGGETHRVHLRDPVVRAADRSRTTCAACGTLADTSLSRFRITCGGACRPGGEARFDVDMAGCNLGRARALFQVRDKTRPTAYALREVDVFPGAQLTFALPDDAGTDIWSARLVAFVAGTIEYARCVFAVRPARRTSRPASEKDADDIGT